MPTFNYKPAEIEAEFWDGTLEGAKKIRELMDRTYPNRVLTYRHEMARGKQDYAQLDVGPHARAVEATIFACRWVVVGEGGSIQSLSSSEFEKQYTPAVEEKA